MVNVLRGGQQISRIITLKKKKKSRININYILRHLSSLTFRLVAFRLLKNPDLARYIDRFPVLSTYVSIIAFVASNSVKLTRVKEQSSSIEKI